MSHSWKTNSTTYLIIVAAQRGDAEALDTLVNRYRYVGECWLKSMSAPPELSIDDVLNDVFLDLVKKREIENFQYRSSHSFRKFFYAVLRLRFLSHIRKLNRKKSKRSLLEPENQAESLQTEEEIRIWKVNLARIAISDWLDDLDRKGVNPVPAKLFQEIYRYNHSLREASARLGISESLGKKLHMKGKAVLQSRILVQLRDESADDAEFMDELRVLCGPEILEMAESCPDEGDIREYVLGLSNRETQRTLRIHLADCIICQPRRDAIERELLGDS